MNKKPDLKEGQMVWVEGRRHSFYDGWFSAYGEIVWVVREDAGDETESGAVIAVFVEHDDDMQVEYDADCFTEWNDRNNSWTIRK